MGSRNGCDWTVMGVYRPLMGRVESQVREGVFKIQVMGRVEKVK